MPAYITFEDISNATNRIPFDNFDGLTLKGYLKGAINNDLDVRLPFSDADALLEMMGDGFLLLASLSLDNSFLFVKVDAGKGLFGKQKSKILVYLGDFHRTSFTAGPAFNSFGMAVTSINNIYRGVGALRGPAL